jgi:hypothetical protein
MVGQWRRLVDGAGAGGKAYRPKAKLKGKKTTMAKYVNAKFEPHWG